MADAVTCVRRACVRVCVHRKRMRGLKTAGLVEAKRRKNKCRASFNNEAAKIRENKCVLFALFDFWCVNEMRGALQCSRCVGTDAEPHSFHCSLLLFIIIIIRFSQCGPAIWQTHERDRIIVHVDDVFTLCDDFGFVCSVHGACTCNTTCCHDVNFRERFFCVLWFVCSRMIICI